MLIHCANKTLKYQHLHLFCHNSMKKNVETTNSPFNSVTKMPEADAYIYYNTHESLSFKRDLHTPSTQSFSITFHFSGFLLVLEYYSVFCSQYLAIWLTNKYKLLRNVDSLLYIYIYKLIILNHLVLKVHYLVDVKKHLV